MLIEELAEARPRAHQSKMARDEVGGQLIDGFYSY